MVYVLSFPALSAGLEGNVWGDAQSSNQLGIRNSVCGIQSREDTFAHVLHTLYFLTARRDHVPARSDHRYAQQPIFI
jgi:hypothetical protein